MSWSASCSVTGVEREPGCDDAFGEAQSLFVLRDDRITESSGVVASSRAPGVLFTHNDSGGGARFYAVGADGDTLATYTVAGARPWDWEDMAAGRGADGEPVLYLADIGDNASPPNRSEVIVYEVAEPRPAAGDATLRVRASYRLRYPDRPHDAETLLADPAGGRLAVVTKARDGRSAVYATAERPSASRRTTLRRVARLDFGEIGSGAGFGLELMATGGAVAPDGAHVVVRTYDEAFEWPLRDFDLARAFAAEPTRIDLPLQPQGEAITYEAGANGEPGANALVVTSERAGAPVYRLERTAGC